MTAPNGTQSLAVRELLGFPASLLAALPLPTAMLWRVPGQPGPLRVSTLERLREAPRGFGAAFAGAELEALIVAAENDRAASGVLAQWCAWKRTTPTWRLDRAEALGGLVDVLPEQGWPLARVLRAWGAELVAVGCVEEVPT
jgi:hypothetical protein